MLAPARQGREPGGVPPSTLCAPTEDNSCSEGVPALAPATWRGWALPPGTGGPPSTHLAGEAVGDLVGRADVVAQVVARQAAQVGGAAVRLALALLEQAGPAAGEAARAAPSRATASSQVGGRRWGPGAAGGSRRRRLEWPLASVAPMQAYSVSAMGWALMRDQRNQAPVLIYHGAPGAAAALAGLGPHPRGGGGAAAGTAAGQGTQGAGAGPKRLALRLGGKHTPPVSVHRRFPPSPLPARWEVRHPPCGKSLCQGWRLTPSTMHLPRSPTKPTGV